MNLDGIDTTKELLLFVKVWAQGVLEWERENCISTLAGKFIRVSYIGGDRFHSVAAHRTVWLITSLNGRAHNSGEEAVILGVYNGGETVSQEEKDIYEMLYPGLGIASACGDIL